MREKQSPNAQRRRGWLQGQVRLILLALLVASGTMLPAAAQQMQVTLDPAQTKINISVHDVHGGVQGTFNLKSGVILFDQKTGDASGELIVDAGSGQTGNSSRDSKMNKDVLESKRYPEITFSPKHVSGSIAQQGSSNIQVQGVFRIHGADHALTLAVLIQVNGDRTTGSTSFEVPYESWGMKNPSLLFLRVDGKAEVSVTTAGRIAATSQR